MLIRGLAAANLTGYQKVPLDSPCRSSVGGDVSYSAQKRRGDIQGLRAVAVLLVLFSHAGIAQVRGGYVGVDVFFVISGFLITGILIRELARTGRISIGAFYARRARRILPAATLVLVTTALVSRVVFTSARQHDVLRHVLWAAFFSANVYSSRSGSDYFAADAFVSPVQHYWSLAVEEQFYLVWPPLLMLILLAIGVRRVGHSSDRLSRLPSTVAVLCIVSLAWSIRQTQVAPTKAYYSTLTRGWELGAGALLALSVGRHTGVRPVVQLIASWVGLGAIATAAVTYSAVTPFPGYHALVPVLGTALVLAGGATGSRWGARRVLDTRPMRWFGDISYSLYLWHWPFLLLPESYLARKLTLVECGVATGAATVAAWLSYRYVEIPVRRSGRLAARRARSLLLWPAAVTVVWIAVLVGGMQLGSPPGATTAVGDSALRGGDAAVGAVGDAVRRVRAHERLPDVLRPSLSKLDADVSRLPAGCGVERDDPAVSTCVLGDPAAARTMVLFGDSHVIMWRQPLEEFAKARGWRIVAVQKASCFPLDTTLWRSDTGRPYTECDTWRTRAYRKIASLKPEQIIISGRVPPIMTDPATGHPAGDEVGRQLFTDGVASTLSTLRKVTRRITVIGGTPNLPKPAGDCLGTRRATMATCVGPAGTLLQQRNEVWRRAAERIGAHFVDPLPWLCADNLCPMVVRGVIVYRDSNHITQTFAETLRFELAKAISL
jgi:peptidoglycan/LPS O-acetylase OafA/YrhL